MNWLERRKRVARRRWMLRVVLLVPLLPAIGLLVGTALPRDRVATGELLLKPSPESVWLVLTDLDGMPRWRSDLTALERLPDLDGRPAWKEIGPGGIRVVQLVELQPLHRLVMRRADGGRKGGGNRTATRTVELTPAPGGHGTWVTVTERDELRNPLERVLIRLRLGRATAPRFLRDLAQLLDGPRRLIAAAPE